MINYNRKKESENYYQKKTPKVYTLNIKKHNVAY